MVLNAEEKEIHTHPPPNPYGPSSSLSNSSNWATREKSLVIAMPQIGPVDLA